MKLSVIEDLNSFKEQAEGMFLEHVQHCEPEYYKAFGFSLNTELLQQAIDQGNFLLVAAEEDGSLVGYLGSFVTPSLLVKDKLDMSIQFLYVVPEHRRSNKASFMLDEMYKLAKDLDISWINLMLPNKDYSDSFADSVGFSKATQCYGKEVK